MDTTVSLTLQAMPAQQSSPSQMMPEYQSMYVRMLTDVEQHRLLICCGISCWGDTKADVKAELLQLQLHTHMK
jgi:hypothetical protein